MLNPKSTFMQTIITDLFGQGKDLNCLQMSCRAIAVFLIALVLIRISGRRSFGLHTPLDNVITIALGAVLSRAIVGASDFAPIIAASTAIVLMHRFVGWMIAHNKTIEKWTEGDKMILFQNAKFDRANMGKAMVCEEEVMQGIRKSALTENLEKIDKIYMERNGEISGIKKD
jgi:uncharacterized membrane protein YcaP (DUF421 family)